MLTHPDSLSDATRPAWRRGLLALALLAATTLPAAADIGKPPEVSVADGLAQIEPQIVGGTEVSDTRWQRQFRFMVALTRADGFQFCGGTLISDEWVLTAAHCLPGRTASDVFIRVNTPVLSAGGTVIPVAGLIPHPAYDPSTEVNDIALIRLAQPVLLPIVPLADDADMSAYAAPGSRVTAIGWGDTTEGGSSSDRLREVRLPMIPNGRCRAALPGDTITRFQFCAGRRAGGVDTCQGDSGGPVLAFTDEGWAQVGITSWGYGCAQPELYGVYTRVASYGGWIQAVMGGLPACIERGFAPVIRRPGEFQCFGLPATDDGSTAELPLGFPVRMGDTFYSSVFVNNNGNLTFVTPFRTYTALPLIEVTSPIIAPFFGDVDTRGLNSRIVYYGQGIVRGRRSFSAIWQRIGYFDRNADRLNTFQVVLTENGVDSGNFTIEFNYDQIQWETGDVSGGVGGLGGQSARAGFSLVPGHTPFARELPGSGVPGSFIDGGPQALATGSNIGIPGRFLWTIYQGAPL